MSKKLKFLAMVLIGILLSICQVWATDEVYKEARFGDGKNSAWVAAYTSSWYSTNNGFRVNVENGNDGNSTDKWSHVRFGRKGVESTGTIITNAAIDDAVTKVDLNITYNAATSKVTINLYMSSDGSAWGSSVGTFTNTVGKQTVNIASPTANRYYKIEFVCGSATNSEGNGFCRIDAIDFYHSAGGSSYTLVFLISPFMRP